MRSLRLAFGLLALTVWAVIVGTCIVFGWTFAVAFMAGAK